MKVQEDIISTYLKVLQGNLRRFPPETWNPHKGGRDNAYRAFRYLILELLKWDRATFVKLISRRVIKQYCLNGALIGVFNKNIYDFARFSFPEWKIKAWELESTYVPNDFWTPETAKEAFLWLLKDKLKWSYAQTLNNISVSTFMDNNLHGLLKIKFNNSPYTALKFVMPEKDWELVKARKGHPLTFELAEKNSKGS